MTTLAGYVGATLTTQMIAEPVEGGGWRGAVVVYETGNQERRAVVFRGSKVAETPPNAVQSAEKEYFEALTRALSGT